MNKKNVFALLFALPLLFSSCDKDDDLTNSDNFSPQWDTLIDNSSNSSDVYIGTKYIGIPSTSLVAEPPYIYIGAAFPKSSFANTFDQESVGEKNPANLIFDFPVPYLCTMEKVTGSEYLKSLKEAIHSEEYTSYKQPTAPYILKMAQIGSLSNLNSCFPDNEKFGKALAELCKQRMQLENVKSMMIGKIVVKGFPVSMDIPTNGLFVNDPSDIDNLVYVRSITYGATAYFVVANELTYQEALNAFKSLSDDDYQDPTSALYKSQIVLLTVSDLNQEASIKGDFEDLKLFMEKPFLDGYGYPIYCKGLNAKDNSVFVDEK